MATLGGYFMITDMAKLDLLMKEYDFPDFKYIIPAQDIVMSEWTRFRCLFGCSNYGKMGTCPPAVPAFGVCRRMVREYTWAMLIHFTAKADWNKDDERRTMLRLVGLERAVFMLGGYKAFLLECGPCSLCPGECPAGADRTKCADPLNARPGADALGIDIFETARRAGYQIHVLKSHDETADRFAILLLE
jgi:predicted metal-binding protein